MTDIEDGQGEWLDKDRRLWLLRVPNHVRNPATYYDRTVQEWHRTQLSEAQTAIDVDLIGYCKHCYHVLYVIEASESVKYTGLVNRVAQACGAVGIIVVHERRTIRQARRCYPVPQGGWMKAQELADYLRLLRQAHHRTHHHD